MAFEVKHLFSRLHKRSQELERFIVPMEKKTKVISVGVVGRKVLFALE